MATDYGIEFFGQTGGQLGDFAGKTPLVNLGTA